MSGTLRLRGATSGYSELQAPAVAADQTFVLPTAGGTLLTTDSPIAELTLQLGSASAPSLRFEGDTDTGLYSSGTNTLNLVTGGSNRLNIDSLGRVSIGTSSALTGSTLTVAGNALAVTGQNTAHSANSIRIGEEGSGAAQIRCYGPDASTNGSLTLRVSRSDGSNSQDVKIDSSGNVGIGTTSPSTLLHLETGHAKQTLKSTNTNTASSIIFDTTNVTTADFLLGQIAGKWNGTDVAQINFEAGSDTTNKDDGIISFATSAASGSPTERMRIDSSGRVGIGTTSPAKALEIYRDSFPCLMLNDGGQYKSYIQLGGNDLEIRGSSGTIEFYGGAADGLSSTERMRIDGSGRVGINTFGNTGAGLHVDNVTGTTGFGSPVIKCGGSTSWTGNGTVYSIGFGYVNGANVKSPAEIGLVTTSSSSVTKGDLVFATRDVVTSTAPLERMRITSDGDVGIGTDSPYVQAWGPSAKQLHVTGSHYGVIHFTNTTYGGTWSHGAGGSSKQLYGAYDLTHTTHWMEIFPGTGVTRFKGVYDNGSSGAANVYVHTDGGLYRSTSSIKYKTDVETLENQYADAILNCRPVWYRSLCDIDIVDKDKQKSNFGYYGFIAEEVADIDPRLVSWKTTKTVKATDGWEQTVENLDPSEFEPEGVNYTTFIPLMLNLIKRQSKEIELLKNKVAALEAN